MTEILSSDWLLTILKIVTRSRLIVTNPGMLVGRMTRMKYGIAQ